MYEFINDLNNADKEILRIASNAIYFNDNSDYLSALWEIVNIVSDNKVEDCDSKLFDLLNED